MKNSHTRVPRSADPRKSSDRGALHAERIQLSLARELAELFRDEISDPSLEGTRVIGVVLSKDGRYARVHVALPSAVEPSLAEAALARAAGFLRSSAAISLSLERMPELRFVTHPGVED